MKTWSEGFHATSLQSTNLFGPLLETVGYEAAVGGDDHSVYVRRVDLVLLKVLVGAVELTRLALVIAGFLKCSGTTTLVSGSQPKGSKQVPFLQSKHLDAAERVAVLYVVIGGADPLAIRVPPLDADPETRS